MFASDLRLFTSSSSRFRLTIFSLLCLSASSYCIIKTFYLMIDYHNMPIITTSTHADAMMKLHLNRNNDNYIRKAMIQNLTRHHHQDRTKRDTASYWSPLTLTNSVAPPIMDATTRKIDNNNNNNNKQTSAISNKDAYNKTLLLETLANVYSSISSLVGAKAINQQPAAIKLRKSSLDSNNNRIATRNDYVPQLRPTQQTANNYHITTIKNRQSSLPPMSSLPASAVISRKGKNTNHHNITSIIHQAISHLATTNNHLTTNNSKQNKGAKGGEIDSMIVNSSTLNYSRSSVPLMTKNYDYNQWKPIPDDYNGPLLPVQVDVVDGFYESANSQRGGKPHLNSGNTHMSTMGHKGAGPAIYHHHNRDKQLEFQQSIPRSHKIYKRVLLCDKTLVSLDFAQNLMAAMDNNNLIDFEALNILSSDDNINHVRSSFNKSSNNNEMKAINRNHINSVMKVSDPLVACDMWDLEKGLTSRKPPRETLRQAVKIDFPTIRDAINKCRALGEKVLPPAETDQSMELTADDIASIFSVKRGLMPGTKWCGLGDSASSYSDLGSRKRIDICCRAHDHCPMRLKPFRQGYGILNLGIYTKSHCDCDEDFYRCLKSTRTKAADLLGNIYFNVLKLQCMHEEKLKICKVMKKVALGFEKCVKWEESPDKRVFRFIQAPVAY